MPAKFIHFIAPLFFALIFAACGDTTVIDGSVIDIVHSGESLDSCTQDNAGAMVYVFDSAAVYYCNSSWKLLDDDKIKKDTIVVEKTVTNVDTVVVSKVDTIVVKDTVVGLNGESCTAVSIDEGVEVSCNGEVIDTLMNGADGQNGIGCEINDLDNGKIVVSCGGNDLVKADTLYKAFCASSAYDPAKSFCKDGSVYDLCNNDTYDVTKSFCQDDVIYDFCNGSSYDVTNYTCDNNIIFGSLTDRRDNQIYKTVIIGSQEWMAQNLNYAYNEKTSSLDSSSFCYNNSVDSCSKYGRLYLWSAAMDSVAKFSENGKGCGYDATCTVMEPARGVCPEGWHVPSESEWRALFTFIGPSPVGMTLKAASGWYNNNNCNDIYGFSVLPCGRYYNGSFDRMGLTGNFWSSTVWDDSFGTLVYYMFFTSSSLDVSINHDPKNIGHAIRCLKDSE